MDPDAQLESLIGGRSAGATAPLIVTAWSPGSEARIAWLNSGHWLTGAESHATI